MEDTGHAQLTDVLRVKGHAAHQAPEDNGHVARAVPDPAEAGQRENADRRPDHDEIVLSHLPDRFREILEVVDGPDLAADEYRRIIRELIPGEYIYFKGPMTKEQIWNKVRTICAENHPADAVSHGLWHKTCRFLLKKLDEK